MIWKFIMQRRKLTDWDKTIIGLVCANCGSKDDLSYHHIVPLSLGGIDTNTNMVCLCGICHDKLHNGKTDNDNFNHGELIKNGMKIAKENGTKFGRPKTNIDDIPYSFKKMYPALKNGIIGISEMSRMLNISRNSIYKYRKILDNINYEQLYGQDTIENLIEEIDKFRLQETIPDDFKKDLKKYIIYGGTNIKEFCKSNGIGKTKFNKYISELKKDDEWNVILSSL